MSPSVTCNMRNEVNSYFARLPIDGLQGDNSSRLRTSDSVCARLRIPHAVVPAVAECETNQVQRTRSPFFACTLCSRGTRCAWTVLDEIAPPAGSHSLFCLASPHRVVQRSPRLLKEDQE